MFHIRRIYTRKFEGTILRKIWSENYLWIKRKQFWSLGNCLSATAQTYELIVSVPLVLHKFYEMPPSDLSLKKWQKYPYTLLFVPFWSFPNRGQSNKSIMAVASIENRLAFIVYHWGFVWNTEISQEIAQFPYEPWKFLHSKRGLSNFLWH